MMRNYYSTTAISKLSFLALSIIFAASLSGFTPKESGKEHASDIGVFSYMVNDKVFTLENMSAVLRTTTGGRKQLSLSNDRFVKFFFIEPKVKNFNLSTADARESIVRYNEPGTNNIYVPKAGYVNILKFDETTRTLTGEFEMELCIPGKDKVIRIKKGQFNVPVVVLR